MQMANKLSDNSSTDALQIDISAEEFLTRRHTSSKEFSVDRLVQQGCFLLEALFFLLLARLDLNENKSFLLPSCSRVSRHENLWV